MNISDAEAVDMIVALDKACGDTTPPMRLWASGWLWTPGCVGRRLLCTKICASEPYIDT